MEVHCAETGKAYDENLMREYVNSEFDANGWQHRDLPLQPVAHPKTFGEDPRRAELIRREDAEAMREIAELRAQSAEAAQVKEINDRRREFDDQRMIDENARLARENADLRARLNGGVPTPEDQQPRPSAAGPTGVVKEGEPNLEWTINEMADYAVSKGVQLPESGSRLNTMGRKGVLEFIQSALKARSGGTEPTAPEGE